MNKNTIQFRRLDQTRVSFYLPCLLDTRIGVAQTLGQLLGHIRVARLQVPRDGHGDRRGAMGTHARGLDFLCDAGGKITIDDPRLAVLIHADDVGRALQKLRVTIQIGSLFVLKPLHGASFDHGIVAFSDGCFQADCVGCFLDPVVGEMRADFAGLLDHPIATQHLLALQKRAKFHMHIVEDVPRLFQIGAALEIEIPRLRHLGEIIGDPLMLECCVLGTASIRATTSVVLIPVPRRAVSIRDRNRGSVKRSNWLC